jgi:hypothetical protein
MGTDNFKGVPTDLSSPGLNAATVTPSDSADITFSSRALYIGVTGDVTVNMAGNGSSILFKSVPVGILPIRVSRVLATGTTATNIVAVW